MTKLEALEAQIKNLSPKELAQRRWLLELDAAQWDREIERDAASGKLDKLFEKSVADHRTGKSREIFSTLPAVISGHASTHCRRKFRNSPEKTTSYSRQIRVIPRSI